MLIHRAQYKFNYGTTEESFTVKGIKEVYGKAARRLYLVEWCDHPGSESWEPEHLLLEDGCKPTIDEFWLRSKKNLASAYHLDPNDKPRCWVCGWSSSKSDKPRYLKAHLTRKKHWWSTHRNRLSAKKDVRRDKLEARQEALPKVKWGNKPVKNCWRFKYLGSVFTPDGRQINGRCLLKDSASAHKGWSNAKHVNRRPGVKLRLYKSAVCSIMVYGAECWKLDSSTCRMLNEVNEAMLTHITGSQDPS